jgi:hypothetical protein
MSALRHWLAASLLALLGWLPAAQAGTETGPGSAPRISLLSFAPGPVYWQRFGHNALMVEPGDGGATAVYNYGIFDFFQKNFFLNFARGHMLYRLAAIPVPNTLAEYAAEGRWVYVQELALSETQARALAAFLADNALPQNAEYRYDYFRANCSTRVRDALDQTVGGALKQAWSQQPTSTSYRREATRLMSPVPALMLGMDYLLGPAADRPISLWEQAFVPEVLMRAVREARIEGRPLVAREGYWLPPAGGPEAPAQAFNFTLPALLLGLAWATALWLLHRQRRRPAARGAFLVLALLPSLLSGLGGVVLLAAWTLTDHWAMWANHNLLLFSPLSLLLLPSLIASARAQWRPGRMVRLVAALIALGALLCLPLQLLPGAQQQLPWIAFWLPLHAALAWNLRLSGRAPPAATR